MNFTPKHNHVVIEPLEAAQQKQGKFVIPDNGNEISRVGTVLAVGIGTFTIGGECLPMQCKVGEKVYYPAMGGQKITIDGKDYVIMKDTDVLTAIEE
jgi:chaperonin GroES